MNAYQHDQRIHWIDCAKGLAMLLVIVSHSVHGTMRGVVFSFHMPLFFILSGMTHRFPADIPSFRQKTRVSWNRLMVPALVLFGLTTAAELVTAGTVPENFIPSKLLTLFFSSGAGFSIHGWEIGRLGIPWFLVALFLSRTILDAIHLRIHGVEFAAICAGLTLAGICAGQMFPFPLSLDVALAATGFLFLGHALQKTDLGRKPWRLLLGSGTVWAVTLLITKLLAGTYLELAMRRYPLFPLCYLTALAGTLMISSLCILLENFRCATNKLLQFCGRHSLMLLCIHALDHLWAWVYKDLISVDFLSAAVRVMVDLGLFFLIMILKRRFRRRI